MDALLSPLVQGDMMSPFTANIEFKARIRDLAAVKDAARDLSEQSPEMLWQKDTFFHAARGRLKVREFENGTGQLIYYERSDEPIARPSHFMISPTRDPQSLRLALTAALGILGEVQKWRLVFQIGRTRVNLDEVTDLGVFVEIEHELEPEESEDHARAVVEGVRRRLGLEPTDLVPESYINLLLQARGVESQD